MSLEKAQFVHGNKRKSAFSKGDECYAVVVFEIDCAS